MSTLLDSRTPTAISDNDLVGDVRERLTHRINNSKLVDAGALFALAVADYFDFPDDAPFLSTVVAVMAIGANLRDPESLRRTRELALDAAGYATEAGKKPAVQNAT